METKNLKKREKLAEIFQKTRVQKGISQQEIADRLGINVNTISRFETGKFGLNSDLLMLIAEAIGLEIKAGEEKI